MRVWGRATNPDGSKYWVEVSTDANGLNDAVYLTAFIQCLKLNLGESPFYGNFGVPMIPSLVTQIYPDFYVQKTVTQYVAFFISLKVIRFINVLEPSYKITVLTHSGAIMETVVPT